MLFRSRNNFKYPSFQDCDVAQFCTEENNFPRNDVEGYSLAHLWERGAFTLAEVLITLGIIGVVAALTIPSLITNYKAHRLRSQFLKSYSVVQQVFKQMEADDVSLDPPYGTGATLYLRPFMFGSAPVMGVKPSAEYQFRIFASPVGPYFKGGAKPITLTVSDFDRAAPHGTGHVKAGLNYAMSLHARK